MLNPDLDTDMLATKYREDGRVRITDVLEPAIAARIRSCCKSNVPFNYVAHVDGKNLSISRDEMAQFDQQQLSEFQRKILDAAADGIGFFYCGYLMSQKRDDTDDENMQFLHSVFDYLNGDEVLSFIRAITGNDEIRSADAQYTRYTPGHFLTRHRDENSNQRRRVAYVLSLSENWHPDWGGLLQFFEDDGTPRDAWAPQFNALSLFDVRHVHSVTFVTPFAREPRLSLTGWFRAID